MYVLHTGDRKYVFSESKGFIKSKNQTARGLVFKLNGMNTDFNKRMLQDMMKGDNSTCNSSFDNERMKEVSSNAFAYSFIHTYIHTSITTNPNIHDDLIACRKGK